MTFTPSQLTAIEQRYANTDKSRSFRNLGRALNLKHKKVLDIGCSFGEHLTHFGEGSIGLTVSNEEVEYGKLRGLDIRKLNFEEDVLRVTDFDVVYANCILEHVFSPHRFLMKTRHYLKNDGTLLIGVPALTWIPCLDRLWVWKGVHAVQHVSFFTYKTVRHTIERAGYEARETRLFVLQNKFLDQLFLPFTPHVFVICRKKAFEYHEKKQKELKGYRNLKSIDEDCSFESLPSSNRSQ